MNRLLFYIIFPFSLFAWLCNTSLAQQNLVPNGSFEEYWECPTSYSTPGDPQFEKCKYWFMPTQGTSDYMNTCANPSYIIGIPLNASGYQYSFDGNGYAGLFALHISIISPDNYREYIQTKLIECLVNNTEYYFEFYACRGDRQNIAIDRIGALFTDYAISRNDPNPIITIPQIESPRYQILDDTVNWTKISGTFVANGGECYLTIGNFRSTEETNYVWTHPEWEDDYAVYFIDGISLIEVESKIQVPNIFTPNADNFNDLFIADCTSIINFEAFVYNRWGQQLYSWINPNEGWDGKFKGVDCSEGAYFYTINAKGIEGKIYNLNGSFQLLR